MNKKVAIGAGIAVLAIAVVIVGIKTTMGDKALDCPGKKIQKKRYIFKNQTSPPQQRMLPQRNQERLILQNQANQVLENPDLNRFESKKNLACLNAKFLCF